MHHLINMGWPDAYDSASDGASAAPPVSFRLVIARCSFCPLAEIFLVNDAVRIGIWRFLMGLKAHCRSARRRTPCVSDVLERGARQRTLSMPADDQELRHQEAAPDAPLIAASSLRTSTLPT
jgi:hypothetical protein